MGIFGWFDYQFHKLPIHLGIVTGKLHIIAPATQAITPITWNDR